MSKCACGSGNDYSNCCEKYINGSELPKTAELLMKSRYSAYVNGEIDYILETNNPATRENINQDAVRTWSESADWQNLVILECENGKEEDKDGIVEFQAIFKLNNVPQIHHERSLFEKIDGKWFYTSHMKIKNTDKTLSKIGRNDPCPCGSGKKYKKCCG